MKKIGVICLALLFSNNTFAYGGVSRSCAAAGAQESISVDWGGTPHWFWTVSQHYNNSGQFLHEVRTIGRGDGWDYTWRSYAGHLASEFYYGRVDGFHWVFENGINRNFQNTRAYDCNLAEWG